MTSATRTITRRFAPLGVCLALAVAGGSQPCSVDAQRGASSSAQNTALARSLFEEGVRLARARDWPAAEDRFRRALGLRAAATIRLNLALVLIERTRLVEASELLRLVANDSTATEAIRRQARETGDRIASRIARITVRLDGDVTGVAVSLDREPLANAAIGVPIPVDPGEHQLWATRDGEPVGWSTVTLGDGQVDEVALVIRATITRTPPSEIAARPGNEEVVDLGAPSVAMSTAQRDEGGGGIEREWWFWTLVGVAVIGAGIGIGVAASSGGARSPERGNYDPPYLDVSVRP